MKNQLNQAIHEVHHAIDAGDDYEASVEFVAQRFNVETQVLHNAYNEYILSL